MKISNSIFYLLCGLPGSGKSTYCNYLKELHKDSSFDLICHDKEVIEYQNITKCGKNRARSIVHKNISEKLKSINPNEKNITILDGVNFNKEGRDYFLNLIPKEVNIIIVFFEHNELIINGAYDLYVNWLHESRKSHYCFPTDHFKAVDTMYNIYSHFDEITSEESEKYEIIRIKSFDRLSLLKING
jgi:ABC-type oligopeptide transport system ATPase subunit